MIYNCLTCGANVDGVYVVKYIDDWGREKRKRLCRECGSENVRSQSWLEQNSIGVVTRLMTPEERAQYGLEPA